MVFEQLVVCRKAILTPSGDGFDIVDEVPDKGTIHVAAAAPGMMLEVDVAIILSGMSGVTHLGVRVVVQASGERPDVDLWPIALRSRPADQAVDRWGLNFTVAFEVASAPRAYKMQVGLHLPRKDAPELVGVHLFRVEKAPTVASS